MSSPVDDRMDALSEAIARLLRRLDGIERRLSRLEAAMGILEAPAPAAVPPPSEPVPSQVVGPGASAGRQAEGPPRPTAPPAPPPAAPIYNEPEPVLETRVGLTWINRIGALTLVCAAGFFFKYAVDNQWIGETGRVTLGAILGMAALAFAEYLWRKDHRVYAQGITGAGIAILYLSFYAAFGFYHLMAQGAAFFLMALTTVLAGTLAVRYESLAVSLLGLVGGYLTPILLSTHEDRPWAFFGYLLLLDAGAIAVARRPKWGDGSRALELLTFAGTALLYWAWFADRFQPEKQLVATVYALAFYALFSLLETPWVMVASQLLAYLAMLAIWPAPSLTFLWLALALAVAGLFLSERRDRSAMLMASFGGYWMGCIVWQGALSGPRPIGAIVLALTPGFLLFLGWSAWSGLVKRAPAQEWDLVSTALNGAAYFGICYNLLQTDHHAYLGAFAVVLAAIHVLLGLQLWQVPAEGARDERAGRLYLGIGLCFLTLAAPIQFSSYRVTMAWALEGAAVAWIAVRTSSSRLVNAALMVFALTLCRLVLSDAWVYANPGDYVGIANARFLTFAIAAASLWAAAYWTRAGMAALGTYVAGHFVLLWALIQEALGAADRHAAAANAVNVESVSVSVLIAAYGVVLVGAGVLKRSDVNRMQGLGLLGLVVLKLYLYDVWLLERMYRVIAFGLLGVLLLGTSFLYSKHRTKMESWWRDGPRAD